MLKKKDLVKVVPVRPPDLWANDLRVQVAEFGRHLRLWHNCTKDPQLVSLLPRICQELKLTRYEEPVTATADHKPVALSQEVYPLRNQTLIFSGTWLFPLSFIIDGREITLDVLSSESLDDAVRRHTEPGKSFILVRQTMDGGVLLSLTKPIHDLCRRKRLEPGDSITVYYSSTPQAREIIVTVINHRGQQFPKRIKLDKRDFMPESELYEQLLEQNLISPYYHCTLTAQGRVQSKITRDYLSYEFKQTTNTIKTRVWCDTDPGTVKDVFVKRNWAFNDLVVKSGLTPPPSYDIAAVATKKGHKRIVSPMENVFTYFETEEEFIIRGFVLQKGTPVNIRCAVTWDNVPGRARYEEIELDGRKTVQDLVRFLNVPNGYTISLKLHGKKPQLLATSPQRLTDLCPEGAMEVEISKAVAKVAGTVVDTWKFDEISAYQKVASLAKDCFLFSRKGDTNDVVLLTAARMGPEVMVERIRDIRSLMHPCILECLGLAEVRGDVFTVHRAMPKVELLANVVTTPKFKGAGSTAKTRIIVGMAHALRYLHSRKIIHRDLSSSNIVLDEQYRPYIKDSGTARIFDPEGNASIAMTLNVGVPTYMAPELWEQAEDQYDEKVDVWSFAMLALEILSGKPPFAKIRFHALVQLIAGGKLPALPACLRSGWFEELWQQCLTLDPPSRPSFADILDRMAAEHYRIFGDEDIGAITDFVDSIQ